MENTNISYPLALLMHEILYKTDYMDESELRTDRNPDESVHIVCYCPAYNRPAGVCCNQPIHLCLLEFFLEKSSLLFQEPSCLRAIAVLPYAIKWTQTHALVWHLELQMALLW